MLSPTTHHQKVWYGLVEPMVGWLTLKNIPGSYSKYGWMENPDHPLCVWTLWGAAKEIRGHNLRVVRGVSHGEAKNMDTFPKPDLLDFVPVNSCLRAKLCMISSHLRILWVKQCHKPSPSHHHKYVYIIIYI